MHVLFEFQQLDFKDEFAVGHDSPGRKATAAIGVIGRACQFGDLAPRHGQDTLVPSLDDVSHSHFKLEGGLSRILCGCCCFVVVLFCSCRVVRCGFCLDGCRFRSSDSCGLLFYFICHCVCIVLFRDGVVVLFYSFAREKISWNHQSAQEKEDGRKQNRC